MRMGRLLGMLIALVALMGVGLLSISAQDNLLQNAGFDEPFVEADPFGTVATGWTPWFVEDGIAPASPLFGTAVAERILIGDGAQLISSVFATAQAGVYQTVSVPTGATVSFAASAYVWSSIDEADVNVSTVPGLVTVQVGIDPTGGTDPQSAAILWSEASELYDQYHRVSVETSALAEAVTVFVRADIDGDTYISDVYWDDALLTTTDAGLPVATEEAPTEAAPTEEAPTEAAPTEETPTEEAPTEAAPTEETPTEEAPVATEVAPEFLSEVEYVVQSGDNFYDIALAYNSTVAAILAANGMSEDTIIYPGDVLKIPVPVPAAPVITPEPTAEPTAEPTTEATPEPTPEVTPEPVVTEEPRTEEIERVVRRGDTLIAIAREYGMSEFDLAAYNGFTVMDVIFVGQVLRIPATPSGDEATEEPASEPTAEATPSFRRHVIVPGDTLSRIASRYGVTVRAILEINDIPNPNRILYGQVIRIPNE